MINENPIEYGYPDLSIIFLHFSSYYFFKVPFKAMQNVIFGMFNLLYSNNREVEETDKVVLNAWFQSDYCQFPLQKEWIDLLSLEIRGKFFYISEIKEKMVKSISVGIH